VALHSFTSWPQFVAAAEAGADAMTKTTPAKAAPISIFLMFFPPIQAI